MYGPGALTIFLGDTTVLIGMYLMVYQYLSHHIKFPHVTMEFIQYTVVLPFIIVIQLQDL